MSGGEVLIYYHPISFYSQKVLWYLEEKGIPYRKQKIDLANNEQMQPWYMALNSKGTVPLMKCPDGTIIADSNDIILHLEQFSDSAKPTLLPAKMRDQVLAYHQRFQDLDMYLLLIGSLRYPEFAENVQLPSSMLSVLRRHISAEGKAAKLKAIVKCRDQAPRELYEAYNEKMCDFERRHGKVDDKEKLKSELDQLEKLLDDVEQLLAQSKADFGDCDNTYLFGPRFTLSDIDLGALMHRLRLSGLDARYLHDKRPNLQVFVERVRRRDAFCRGVLLPLMPWRAMLAWQLKDCSPSTWLVLGGAVASAGLAVLAAAIVLRHRRL